jgi:uncharacterized protein (TIGR02466 family)
MSLDSQLRDAFSSYQQKNYVEAELKIRDILKSFGENADAYRLGAITALALNQVTTAYYRINEALKTCEMTAETANTLGNILKAAGEWSKSEEAYRHAIDLDPLYEPVRANLIHLLVESGQLRRALKELDEQAQKFGESDLSFTARATVLIKLGHFEEAQTALNSLQNVQITDKIYLLKARLHFHLRDYEKMEYFLEKIPPTSSLAAESFGLLANYYGMRGDWLSCKAKIESYGWSSNASLSVCIKSIQLMSRHESDEYISSVIEKGIARFGRKPELLVEQSKLELRKGRTKKAIELLKEAATQKPGDFLIMTNYAQASMVSRDYQLSHDLIMGAFQHAPNNQYLFALIASLQRECGHNYKTLYDYDRFIRSYTLVPPPHYNSLEHFNEVLKERLESLHIFKDAPLNQSLRGGTQTDIDLSVLNDSVLQDFFMSLDKPIKEYMTEIGKDANHPLTRRNTGQYRINGAWSVRLSREGRHVNHVHPLGWISSSYYVEVPDVVNNSDTYEGWIKFGEPNIEGLNHKAEKYVQPKAGQLVLFPSFMWHGTVPFSSDQTRLTLPFDVVPV